MNARLGNCLFLGNWAQIIILYFIIMYVCIIWKIHSKSAFQKYPTPLHVNFYLPLKQVESCFWNRKPFYLKIYPGRPWYALLIFFLLISLWVSNLCQIEHKLLDQIRKFFAQWWHVHIFSCVIYSWCYLGNSHSVNINFSFLFHDIHLQMNMC